MTLIKQTIEHTAKMTMNRLRNIFSQANQSTHRSFNSINVVDIKGTVVGGFLFRRNRAKESSSSRPLCSATKDVICSDLLLPAHLRFSNAMGSSGYYSLKM